MAAKRPASDSELPSAKRQLLADLVKQLGLGGEEEGSEMTPSDLDALCNEAYDQVMDSRPMDAETSFKNRMIYDKANQPEDLTVYPSETMYKDFPLTKAGTKLIRIGVDIASFSTYILLMGESAGKRMWIRMTPYDFDILTSNEIYERIAASFKERRGFKCIDAGDLILSMTINEKNLNFISLCIQRKGSLIKIFLAPSSWNMIPRAKLIMRRHLLGCMYDTDQARMSWPALKKTAVNYCISKGMSSPDKATEMGYQKCDAVMAASLHEMPTRDAPLFPEPLKQEMMCYHASFVREQIFSAMRDGQ